MRAVLVEADTIVMPRELRIRGGSGEGFALEVANRRILRVRPLSSSGIPTALDPADETAAETLRGLIVDALGPSTSVRLAHWALERDIDPAEPGMSVRGLAEAWSLPLDAGRDGDGDALDQFLSAAATALPAWLMISGDVSESFGDEDLVASLLELHDSGLPDELKKRGSSTTWLFSAVGSTAPGAQHRAVAVLGDTIFLMAIAPGRLGEVADLWRDALS